VLRERLSGSGCSNAIPEQEANMEYIEFASSKNRLVQKLKEIKKFKAKYSQIYQLMLFK
jgi:hypothetical protein